MSDDDLLRLIERTFEPGESFSIIVGKEAAEDQMFGKMMSKKHRIKGPRTRQKTEKRTYDIYVPQYKSWKERPAQSCSSSAVLGAYLYLYTELYGEEDAEFAGKKASHATLAVSLINSMKYDLNITFEEIIEYIETLLPLWTKALSSPMETFPNARPSFRTFFANRKTWAQRFSYYNRWKELT